jgi:hypothetical protein
VHVLHSGRDSRFEMLRRRLPVAPIPFQILRVERGDFVLMD